MLRVLTNLYPVRQGLLWAGFNAHRWQQRMPGFMTLLVAARWLMTNAFAPLVTIFQTSSCAAVAVTCCCQLVAEPEHVQATMPGQLM